jgi:hypothetical protein
MATYLFISAVSLTRNKAVMDNRAALSENPIYSKKFLFPEMALGNRTEADDETEQ